MSSFDEERATEAVDRGAALLDAMMPGWYDRIDLGRLDIGSCEACVMGQIFEFGYSAQSMADVAKMAYGQTFDDPEAVYFQLLSITSDHGFTNFEIDVSMFVLTARWTEAITKRRTMASQAA